MTITRNARNLWAATKSLPGKIGVKIKPAVATATIVAGTGLALAGIARKLSGESVTESLGDMFKFGAVCGISAGMALAIQSVLAPKSPADTAPPPASVGSESPLRVRAPEQGAQEDTLIGTEIGGSARAPERARVDPEGLVRVPAELVEPANEVKRRNRLSRFGKKNPPS